MALVSVILPVRNGALYIHEALQSILEQTLDDLEVIVIDDDSTDDTRKILDEFNDSRLAILQSSRRGFAGALNTGLERSTAPFIARMDADDVCHSQRLETQFEFLNKNPELSLCGTWATLIDHAGKKSGHLRPPVSPSQISSLIWQGCPFVHPSVMFSRARLPHFIFPDGFQASHDYALWWQLLNDGHKFANVQKYLIQYRLHQSSMSTNLYDEMRFESFQLFSEHVPEIELTFEGYLAITSRMGSLPIRKKLHLLLKLKKKYRFTSTWLSVDLLKYMALRVIYLLGWKIEDPRWAKYRNLREQALDSIKRLHDKD